MNSPVHPYAELEALARKRILVLDGAMGSMVQTYGVTEADFRGERFKAWHKDLKNNYDLLNLTRPDIIEDIQRRYLEAGADILETNTFSGTTIAQADFDLEAMVPELNTAAVAIARKVAREAEAKTPGRKVFVAGAIGPLNRTLSMSPDVNRPDYRAVSWEQVVLAYTQQVQALLQAGVDILLVETIFDTLNAKAALFAISSVLEEAQLQIPVMVSVTITDASGRTLSGQTISAFYNSVRHAKPFSVGINCALGGREMRPYIEELATLAECRVSCYPNAGLPNAFGAYDETPQQMSAVLEDFAKQGWLNLVGGCCGSTPEHIAAIAKAVAPLQPRQPAAPAPVMRLSGLEPLLIP